MDGFSCKLKEWRLASGLSQQQIADLLNYGLSTRPVVGSRSKAAQL